MEIGKHCIIEKDVSIGEHVRIGDYVRLAAGTVIEDNVFIDSYVVSSGRNKIGAGSTIRYGCILAREVYVGKNVFMAPRVITLYKKDEIIRIGTDVFIGAGAIIDGGVKIWPDCKIGAGSFVNKDCSTIGLYVGIPAKLKRAFYGPGGERG